MKYDKLLKLKKENKLYNVQGKCPYCGEMIDDYGTVEFEDNMCYFPWHCTNCGLYGEEWYTLDFNGHNIFDENGEQIEL